MSTPKLIPFEELPEELQELYETMQDDLYDGYADKVVEATKKALDMGRSPNEILNYGLIAGMDIVGEDFGAGILFVPEVLMAAKAMKAAMEVLRPLLTQTGSPRIGRIVMGTVKGDIHDIGKNLVSMMLEGAGFEVIDVGINTDAEEFLSAIKEHDADLLGMSALLTTTMPYMKVVIDRLREEGLRDKVRVLVGGAPLSEAFAEEIGADAYCRDASVAVDVAKKFMALKRQAA